MKSSLTCLIDLTTPVIPIEPIETARIPVSNAVDYGDGNHLTQLVICGQLRRDSRQPVHDALRVLRNRKTAISI